MGAISRLEVLIKSSLDNFRSGTSLLGITIVPDAGWLVVCFKVHEFPLHVDVFLSIN